MGFDKIKKGLLVSIRSCNRWVHSYPFILGLVVFFFLFYRFLPSVFSLLLSFSPVFVCTAVILQLFFSFGHPNVHKKDQKEKDDNVSAGAPSLSRRRRDVKDKTESSDYHLHQHHAETSVDGLRQHLESRLSQPAFASPHVSSAVSECSLISNDGNGEKESGAGSVEGGVKPVECTENDEKNLMDLGSSELERNRRLESLIAKRRARKLLRMAGQKDLILIDFNKLEFPQIPAVTTKRNDNLAQPYNSDDASESPIPCSAPSVLLPTRNPFDLPYDPFEEKPNLMDDSFHEEFISVQQKDVHFCRHESFFLGPSFREEPKQDMHDIRFTPFFKPENTASQSVTGGGYPSLRQGTRKTNDSVVSSAPEPEPLPYSVADLGMSEIPGVNNEITYEIDSNSTWADTGAGHEKPEEAIKGEGLSSSLSLEEEDEKLASSSWKIAEGIDNNNKEKPYYNSSPLVIDKKTVDDTLFYVDKGVILTTASSIASDLQVEVSQAGSPSGPLDKSFWDSLVNGDGGIKELNSGNEVPNDAFFNHNDDGNDLRLNEVTKSSEFDTAKARLSGYSDDQVSSPMSDPLVESLSSDSLLKSVAVEQVSIGTSSSSFLPMDEVPSPMSDPNILLDEREKANQVIGNSSDGSSHEVLSHPFKGEESFGSEVPNDASSHTQSSELETTKAGHSEGSDEPATLNVVLESMVLEQVSSHSVPESVAVEKVSTDTSSSYSPPMDQVPLPMSDPNIIDDREKADQVTGNSSDGSSHEGLIHPLKGEVSSGNEVLNGAFPHHSNNENESRSNKITWSSELETSKVGPSGASDEPAAPNVVLEPMVLEQVSSHPVPDSVAVEKVSTDTSSSYSPPMDLVPLPMSDPNIILDEKEKADQVTGNSSDGSSREGAINPFEGEVNSVNEIPNGTFSHHSDNENESRSNKITRSSELETTKAGPSGASDEPAAPNVVQKSMVLEQVSSHSVPESVAVEKVSTDTNSSYSPLMEQVPLPMSDPNIILDEREKADQVTGNSSDGSSHEGLIHPFKGELSSGNEVPNGAFSHRSSDNENELRSKAGISEASELESMVLEQIPSHSVPDSVSVEKVSTHTSSSYSLPMDQVPSPPSVPKIPFDEEKEKSDPVSCNSSDALSHEVLTSLTTGKPGPLVEDPIAQPPPKGVHEEPQIQLFIEKLSHNGEEPQEQSIIPVNSTEETNIIARRNESVVCKDQSESTNPNGSNEETSLENQVLFDPSLQHLPTINTAIVSPDEV
ncbi:hypothetical protein NE237_004993 [Protea cynaroides]|uniref:Uncharacterized protein n=1 Tax=Protea cynaroides TaxID=273540 RepID=A0A9Q0QU74_9MAGN|nr:hypothetical protein NE237_004993 [Protea cynaroides]